MMASTTYMPLDVIKSLENLIELSREHDPRPEHRYGTWWRGHADATWKLLPKVYRKSADFRYEVNCCSLFRQGAMSRHSVCPPDNDLPEWLFLMQHHRLPTRLLDWTESPLVAAFFACHEAPDSDGALWILDPFMLNRIQIAQSVIKGARTPEVLPIIQAAFTGKNTSENKILAIGTNQIDIRMLVQLSAFTIHQPGKPLDEIDGTDKFLQKVTIPSACKPQILKNLDGVGIRLPNLFPDLDHLAEYIAALSPMF